jgi:3-methyladenine DNA glycosylase AlkD
MTCEELMRQLEAFGTAQNRKIYGRHGVSGEMFGVSYRDLGALKKKIKTDHELALELWDTGNHDARVLAMMIADPAKFDSKLADAWIKELDNNVLADAFASFVGKTDAGRKRMERWAGSKDEWTGAVGWKVLAHLAGEDKDLPDSFFEPFLEEIESKIHTSKNRTRDAMNTALIAIGVRNQGLRKKALAAAARIGKVEVDHGETNCQTPDAAAYIEKTLQYRAKKSAK